MRRPATRLCARSRAPVAYRLRVMTDEDDRRDVRSEAEGAAPDEKQAVASERESTDTPVQEVSEEEEQGEREETGKKRKKPGSFWKELPVLIGVALVLALVIKAFAVQAFYIPSASMENTLKIGDRVLVNKIVYHTRDIARGDTVVFSGLDSWDPEVTYSQPSNPISKVLHAIGGAFGLVPGEKDYIKRVIGIPGDRVRCCDAGGHITVNGVPLQETAYLYPHNKPSGQQFGPITVPPGRLWVMGDHRDVS